MLKFFVPPQLNILAHALKYTFKYLIIYINVLLNFLSEFEYLPWVVKGSCKIEGISDLKLCAV